MYKGFLIIHYSLSRPYLPLSLPAYCLHLVGGVSLAVLIPVKIHLFYCIFLCLSSQLFL